VFGVLLILRTRRRLWGGVRVGKAVEEDDLLDLSAGSEDVVQHQGRVVFSIVHLAKVP